VKDYRIKGNALEKDCYQIKTVIPTSSMLIIREKTQNALFGGRKNIAVLKINYAMKSG
jgi:hypothetical protein